MPADGAFHPAGVEHSIGQRCPAAPRYSCHCNVHHGPMHAVLSSLHTHRTVFCRQWAIVNDGTQVSGSIDNLLSDP